MAFNLADDQKVNCTIQFMDDATPPNAVPAPAGAAAVWSSSDSTILDVSADPSDATGMTGLVVAVGPIGVATVGLQITVPGDPKSPYTGVGGDVTVGVASLSAIDISFGVPAHK